MNSCTLENYLQIVAPHLSSELVSPEALSHIQSIARIFPPSSEGLLECRLATNSSKVDFSVLATNLDGNHHRFGEVNSVVDLPNIVSNAPIWRRIQNFCYACYQPNSLLSRSAENIWLEFDIDKEQQGLPIPSLFLGLKNFLNEENNTPISEFIDQQQIITNFLDLLFEDDASPLMKRNLSIYVNQLPHNSQVLYIGAMFSRTLESLRVNIAGITIEEIENYLTNIGWKYPIKPLKEVIQLIINFVDGIILNLDIGNTVYPKIGIECLLTNKSSRLEPKWQLLLDSLVENGLCTSEKRDAVLSWSGYSDYNSHPELWSESLNKVSRFLGLRWCSICFRNLNHIKIVYHPDEHLEAKAYLAFGHSFVCKK